MMIRTALIVLCLGLALPTLASAQDIRTFDAEDSGWYRDDGFHDVDNTNYLTGIFDFTNIRSERNSFFVFDLSSITFVDSATMRLFLPTGGYVSPDSTETFSLFDFTGDPADLINGNGGIAAFDDLADGNTFGSVDIAMADENSFIDIDFNAAGLAFLNSRVGGSVAIGGAVTSLNTATGGEWVFGVPAGGPVPTPSLIVSVPEPSSIALIGFAFAAVTSRRRRR